MKTLASNVLRQRNVVEIWGQSNSNGGLWSSETLSSSLDKHVQKNVLYARHSQLNGENPLEMDLTWNNMYCPNGPSGSFGAKGIPSFGISQVIARRMSMWMPSLAILQCGYGSTASNYWSTNYHTIYEPWCSARSNQIPESNGRLLVLYQGESNCLINTQSEWRGHWEPIIASRRAFWQNPTMPLIIVRLPDTNPLDGNAEMQAEQVALVAADINAVYVTDNTATMGSGPDIDAASTERIGAIIAEAAIGLCT
jgi:hypothetical protein